VPSAAVATPRDLSGRIVVVTGAGPDSIGLATARTLADWGAEVVVSTRSEPLAAPLGDAVGWHPLDLADRASVRAFADWLHDRYDGQLDVLVNNAGIHLDLRSTWTEPPLVDGHEIHWREIEFAYVDGSSYGAPYVELARIGPQMAAFFEAIRSS